MKRIFTIFLALIVLSVPALSGCKKNTDDATAPTEADVNTVKYADLGDNIVAKAGDYEITMDEVNVYIGALAPYIQQSTGSEPGWEDIVFDGKTARDTLIQYAIEEARYQHAFLTYVVEQGYYSEAENEEYFKQYVENSGGEEEYRAFLEEYGFTEEAFRTYASATGAYYALMDKICTDEDALESYNNDYFSAKHILITFDGRESEEAAYNEIKAIYDKAISGESFEKLIEEYNEDPGSEDSSVAYTFTEGVMVDEFYNGTKALEIGAISEPVKTTYGYHIIKRFPLPDENSVDYMNAINEIKSKAMSNYLSEERTNGFLKDYPLTINESILSKIDLSMYTVASENINVVDGSVFND